MLLDGWDNTCGFGAPELHACEVCGYRFARSWQLDIHRLTVAGSRYCKPT